MQAATSEKTMQFIDLNDPASIQALINIITGIVAAIICILYVYRWRLEPPRVALVSWMLFLSVWAALAYTLVLLVDSGINVALLRWVLSGWHITAVGTCLLLHVIQSYAPAELAHQQIRQLEAKIDNLKTVLSLKDGTIASYQKREEDWRAERDRMAGELVEQEREVNRLRRQIVEMELRRYE